MKTLIWVGVTIFIVIIVEIIYIARKRKEHRKMGEEIQKMSEKYEGETKERLEEIAEILKQQA